MNEQSVSLNGPNDAAEIAKLRERLSFYEHFDQLIHDNVSNSSDLLRKAASTQEEASRALAVAGTRAESARLAERSQFRSLFSAMLGEVTTLQGQLERLARRVADTLDDLESDSQLSGEDAPAPAALASGDEAVTPPDAPSTALPAPGVTSEDLDASSPSAQDKTPEAPEGIEPFSAEEFVANFRPTDTASLPIPGEPAPEPAEATSVSMLATPPASDSIGATVLVHGVPRATTALSLKRFLEGLPDVDQVEPREYAEGVLRLLVLGRRAITLEDLRAWPDGVALEPINVHANLVEVRLGH